MRVGAAIYGMWSEHPKGGEARGRQLVFWLGRFVVEFSFLRRV